jgi:hypothetical protein
MNKVNLREKLALFSEHWRLRIVGDLNGQDAVASSAAHAGSTSLSATAPNAAD